MTVSPPVIPVQATPATILVIDDDLAMRTILGITLTALGYVILAAADGEKALEIARVHPEIRLIILDVVMPGFSGKKLEEQLRINLPGCSVLYCSGHPASVLPRYGIDPGAQNFLQKPCRPPELERKIEELLALGQG
ncbi:MAG: two-component system, cell cycle sensor histidine kinase and response regulator CckA [Verrucomicrobiota bacterium]|jgi:DNA-binding response OmpR family regulator